MNILLVVDLQKQFKDKNEEKYNKVLQFINYNSHKFDRVVASVFQNERGSMYEKLLKYTDCLDANASDIEFNADEVIEKRGYALNVEEYIRKKDNVIYIVGCDIDACVMATCFKLWDNKYNFAVIEDEVYTTSDRLKDKDMIEVLKRNFGGCIMTWENAEKLL